MTMAEKIIARNLVGQSEGQCVKPHDPVIAQVQGGYSHEFTTAQVHTFLSEEYGADYTLPNPSKFAVFEDHLLYAAHNPKFVPHMDKGSDTKRSAGGIPESTQVYETILLKMACRREFAIRLLARNSLKLETSFKQQIHTPAWEGRRML